MRRALGKRFLASMPLELHALVQQEALDQRTKNGGHLNLNRVLVVTLYATFKARATPAQRLAIETFIRQNC